MVQPPLDQHYIAMHLGGAKHVTRRCDAAAVSTIVERGSLTLVPAGTAFVWHTWGPIAFAHLYLRPQVFEHVIERELDIDGRGASVIERVGCIDPLLRALFDTMIAEVGCGVEASSLRLDTLLDSFLIELARKHLSRGAAARCRAVALAPHRLLRVLDFIEANLACEVALADLVAASGGSQFHFSRAFREAIGFAPYQYLIRRRLEKAKVLLATSDASLIAVSASCGFHNRRQFSVMFKRLVGVGPKRYRLHTREARRRPLPAG